MALRALQGPAGGAAPVGGTGTTNTIPVWTGASTLGDSPLTVSGSNVTGAGAIRATGTTAGAPAFTGADTDTGIYFPAANQMRFSTAGSPAISIDATQNVGIGATSPGYKLDVSGVINTTDQVRVFSSATSADVRLNAGFGGTVAGLGTVGVHPFMLFTSNTERARIDSAGNFGLGVIPSAWASSVRAEEMRTHARWNYNSGSDSVAYWTVNAFLNSAGNAIYKASSFASQYTQFGGAHVWERAVSGTAGNTVTWLESARIDSSGNLILNTANTSATIQAAGLQQGIKLAPASAASFNTDPNTLDCYQESAWTPTRAGFGGTNPTVTANYTRVGRLVTIAVTLTATGGNQYSGALGSTTLTVPSTMTPSVTASSTMTNGAVANVGNVAAFSDGLIYLPTFGLTTATHQFTITYSV